MSFLVVSKFFGLGHASKRWVKVSTRERERGGITPIGLVGEKGGERERSIFQWETLL